MNATTRSSAQQFLGTMAPRLLAYLRVLLGSLHEAEDVLQELLVRYLDRGPAPHTVDAERWLFRVARNLGLKVIRGNKRRLAREEAYSKDRPETPDPAALLEQRESAAKIQGCLDCLEDELRELVFLKIVEKQSYRVIEEQTGVPRSTAALRVQEGLVQLSSCFHGA